MKSFRYIVGKGLQYFLVASREPSKFVGRKRSAYGIELVDIL